MSQAPQRPPKTPSLRQRAARHIEPKLVRKVILPLLSGGVLAELTKMRTHPLQHFWNTSMSARMRLQSFMPRRLGRCELVLLCVRAKAIQWQEVVQRPQHVLRRSNLRETHTNAEESPTHQAACAALNHLEHERWGIFVSTSMALPLIQLVRLVW